MPLASRGRDHWKEAEVLVMAVTVKFSGAVDSVIRMSMCLCCYACKVSHHNYTATQLLMHL